MDSHTCCRAVAIGRPTDEVASSGVQPLKSTASSSSLAGEEAGLFASKTVTVVLFFADMLITFPVSVTWRANGAGLPGRLWSGTIETRHGREQAGLMQLRRDNRNLIWFVNFSPSANCNRVSDHLLKK